MKNWIDQLLPIRNEFMDGSVDEPMDGDDVDELCKIIKAKLNLHEGNITEEECNEILDSPREDKLDGQEFFDIMQQYRIAPMTEQDKVVKAFERVKLWIRNNCF